MITLMARINNSNNSIFQIFSIFAVKKTNIYIFFPKNKHNKLSVEFSLFIRKSPIIQAIDVQFVELFAIFSWF